MGLATTYGVGQYASGFATEPHMAGWDRAYKTGRRGVIWCHRLFSNEREPFDATNNCLPLLNKIAGSVGPIFAGGSGSSFLWGNSTSQTLLTDAWAWIKAQYGAKTDKVILAGESMGGIDALNWARANPTLVQALVLFYPAVNLQACYEGTGGASAATLEPSINTTYGGVPNYATFDPANGTNPASYTGVPIYLAYSDSDTTVGTANQSAFATAVGGSALTSRVYAGAAHCDMTKVDVNDVASWLASYL